MQELPEKGTLRVVRTDNDTSSVGSSDTDILPHAPELQRHKSWPDQFVVPSFSYEMEHLLAEGNRAYQESGKLLKLMRSQKSDILKKWQKQSTVSNHTHMKGNWQWLPKL